jgi:hypothetical protein
MASTAVATVKTGRRISRSGPLHEIDSFDVVDHASDPSRDFLRR